MADSDVLSNPGPLGVAPKLSCDGTSPLPDHGVTAPTIPGLVMTRLLDWVWPAGLYRWRNGLVSVAVHGALLSLLLLVPLNRPVDRLEMVLDSRLVADPALQPIEIMPETLLSPVGNTSRETTLSAVEMVGLELIQAVSAGGSQGLTGGGLRRHADLRNAAAQSSVLPGEAFLLAQVSPGPGAGTGTGDGVGAGVGDGTGGFFGAGGLSGIKTMVFVVDQSRSMNRPYPGEYKTRFKRVQAELLKTVGGLAPHQQFFIVFFGDQTFPMPAAGLVNATATNLEQHLKWVSSATATGAGTDPRTALTGALGLQPERIYLLTDGEFDPEIRRDLLLLKQRVSQIQTLAIGDRDGEVVLQQIAKNNGGQYRFVE